MENLTGQFVEVTVSKNGKVRSKSIKVCRVKARSILFIEVDKENRKNIFWKLDKKNVENVGESNGNPHLIVKDGVLLSDNKWESPWDSIGGVTPGGNTYGQKHFSNHSKGWAPQYTARLKANSQYNYGGGGAHFRT